MELFSLIVKCSGIDSLTLSWFKLFPITITSDDWNGDCDGDGWSLGLAGIEDDGLGVKNDPVGDNIP